MDSKISIGEVLRTISKNSIVYGLGIILGAGIYALIGEAAGIAGNSLWLSFILAAAVASFTALSYCELSSMFPRSAAEYTYVKHAFKSNLLGFASDDLGNQFIQLTNPGFPGMIFNDVFDDLFRKSDLISLNSMIFQLLGDEMPLGDLYLFLYDIPCYIDYLHPVKQGRMYGRGGICCGNEHHS